MRRRLRLAWHVLRGRPIIYRCLIAIDPDDDRVYLAGKDGEGIKVTENLLVTHFEGTGEVVAFDWRQGLVYPVEVQGRVPR